MNQRCVAVLASMSILCSAALAAAQSPGNSGSVACREVQLEVYDLVVDESPFGNHGQMMRAINRLLVDRIHSGVISGDCAGCIRSQFAQKIPIEEQQRCGEEPVGRMILQAATGRFEEIRELVAPDDTSPPVARFVGSHIEVASQHWVYVLDTGGRQVFRPKEAMAHMAGAFAEEIGPDLRAWEQQSVSGDVVSWAREIASAAFGVDSVFDPETSVIPARELITSKAAEGEAAAFFEGRTMILFRSASLSNDLVASLRTTFHTLPDGDPVLETRSLEVPSRSHETAVTFAPAGHVMRVETAFVSPEIVELVGVYQQALSAGLLDVEQVLYENTLRFGGFFSPEEPRLELTAYSYEGEDFLTSALPYCSEPEDCNPFADFNLYEYCYNSPYAPDVNSFIRPSQLYKYQTFNIWHDYGRLGGFRGTWMEEAQAWEIPNAVVEVHASLADYGTVNPPEPPRSTETCEGFFDFLFSTGNKLQQPFYDDLESCHVAMINTHGGPIHSGRIGRKTFQMMRSYDQWVTLHEEGDDGLGKRRLRHLFLETCSTMNWRNNYRDDPKNLAADFMNRHVADGVRTIAGFDGGRLGGQVTGWRFFGYYHLGESISQSWFSMGLDEFECNMPIIVAYGATEEEAARTLFDGRFSTARAGTGWAIAAEPVTEEHLAPRACCLANTAGPPCVMLSHSDCEAAGGEPLDCGNTCSEHGDKCVP